MNRFLTRTSSSVPNTVSKYLYHTTRRNMSIEYNVIVFDKPGSDRSLVRPAHLKDIPGNVNSGVVKSAAALFTDETKTKFAGSQFHLLANNKEEIIEFLKTDEYYKNGIWDIENVLINPIGVAVRLPKVLDGVNAELYK